MPASGEGQTVTLDRTVPTFIAACCGRCNMCGFDIDPGDTAGFYDDEVHCEECLRDLGMLAG